MTACIFVLILCYMEHEQKTNCGAGGHRAARERIAAALGAAAAALAAHPDPLPAIDRAVARHYGVPVAALASRDRAPAAARARRAAWALGYAGARAPARTLCRRYGGRRVEGVLRAVERAAGGLSPGRAAELAALAWRACADGAAAGLPPGLSAAPAADIRATGVRSPSPRRRPCLTCGQAFRSAGPHNRMCDACREEHAGEPEEHAVHAAIDDGEAPV